MSDINILILGTVSYSSLFKVYGNVHLRTPMIKESESFIQDMDLVVLTGGADVDPTLYGETVGPQTIIDTYRDSADFHNLELALRNSVPVVGICRGAQLLTVAAGGTLIQHVNSHQQDHQVIPITDGMPDHAHPFSVCSTHHQMMNPYGLEEDEYELVAYARNLSNVYINGDGEDVPDEMETEKDGATIMEPEVVYYKKLRALAVQYHPEMMDINSDGAVFVEKCMQKYFKIGDLT